MGNMDGWDVTLLVVAGYVAVTSLVRLMVRRRDQMLEELRGEVAREKNRKNAKKAADRRVA
jgi:hypothetical protein